MSRFGNLNPYDLHKHLINDYLLKRAGDTALLQRDTSRDRTDADVLRENHKFLWEADDADTTWEQQLARKYYDKLFKEYCICDLSRYRENKVALRWRTEKEVIDGKGQFYCGHKVCKESAELRSWEVNFGYSEQGQRKNALIKVRLCPDCSRKLNYHSKKREIKKLKKLSKKSMKKRSVSSTFRSPIEDDLLAAQSSSQANEIGDVLVQNEKDIQPAVDETAIWSTEHKPHDSSATTSLEQKSREEEFDDYLEDLLL